ncbi:hypothetical protein FRACYDRAFT_240894 [Fragilariopsis cylindrus CCMP1102]|uniref:Uncharacterized protein n=1 Tax=Fragilariopsis cylindrus CCMP1102 TaxID=635003 RepID=A0A1E7F8B0_9STRA|nr:hypothetical protein FRACYDRAFT_240894 [Fragilariopsis cylindrus CCMP1102]|eukprot:OEU14354.1 hypothetical protein FRACYDRAFT_240894 [Fragilariopsis cylindrus CCMP1102]
MPLTPRFTLSQTPTHIYVEINVPSFRLSAEIDGGMEVVLMGNNNSEFHFYAKPYLLKLNFFPNSFEDQDTNESSGIESGGVGTAKYDPSEQTVTIPLRKKKIQEEDISKGEEEESESESNNNFWSDLELTARLIEPKEIPKKWLHSVIDNNNVGGGEEDGDNDDDLEEELNDDGDDTSTSTKPNNNTNPLLLPDHQQNNGDGYGFNNMFRNIFTDYCRSGLSEEMLMLRIDPESSTVEERRLERHTKEEKDFDFDRYLNDLDLTQDDYMYPMVMLYKPWWYKNNDADADSDDEKAEEEKAEKAEEEGVVELIADEMQSKLNVTAAATTAATADNNSSGITPTTVGIKKKKKNDDSTSSSSSSLFTDNEKLLLSTIPYPLLSTSTTGVGERKYELWCGLLEILLAYTYDHITTMGDSTVESSWTITVLTSGMSYLESPTSVEEVLHSFLRRVAIYPYWRNIEEFGVYIIKQTLEILHTHGIHGITKCLVQAHTILEKSESHYLSNKLYIDPYLYWVQRLERDCGNEGLTRIILEIESSILTVQPDEDNILVTEVQNSLGIDTLMDRFFQTDSETSDNSSESSDSEEEEEDNEVGDSGGGGGGGSLYGGVSVGGASPSLITEIIQSSNKKVGNNPLIQEL